MKIWIICLTFFVVLFFTKESKAVDAQEWSNFKSKFNKNYPNPQIENQRRAIFQSNLGNHV